jgi:nitrile hydratase
LKPLFAIGENVKILKIDPPGHIRTPYFIRGKFGEVISILGKYANPEELAYGRDGKPDRYVYSVRFLQKDLWTNYNGQLEDSAVVEVMENWLEAKNADQITKNKINQELTNSNSKYKYPHINNNISDKNDTSLEHMAMARAIEELLIEKNIFSTEEMQKTLKKIDLQNPKQGARLVARAWVDSNFKDRLLKDVRSAAKEIDIDIGPIRILAIENTSNLHNAIVCTLCSCYPKHLIGLPPEWYKSGNYRSRMISEPRSVLAEFGTVISNNVELRVYDSTTEVRYLVIPMLPENYIGLNENELIALVTRDSMIGTSIIKTH